MIQDPTVNQLEHMISSITSLIWKEIRISDMKRDSHNLNLGFIHLKRALRQHRPRLF